MALPAFFVHLTASTLGAAVVGFIAAFLLACLTAAFTKNTSGGNWADHVSDQLVLKAADGPYFVFPVLSGFALGALSYRYSRSSSAAWVWVLPTIVLIWNVFTWKNGGSRPYWLDVWDNYFASGCGSSECLYELFVTMPFYTALVYAVGWMTRRILVPRLAA
jgi:hypothetical protein